MSPPHVGTTKYVQTCSCLLSAASRTAGTCPRPTFAVALIVVRSAKPFARNERYGCGIPLAGTISCKYSLQNCSARHPWRACVGTTNCVQIRSFVPSVYGDMSPPTDAKRHNNSRHWSVCFQWRRFLCQFLRRSSINRARWPAVLESNPLVSMRRQSSRPSK